MSSTTHAEYLIGATVEDCAMKFSENPREAIDAEILPGMTIIRRNWMDYLLIIATYMDLTTFTRFVRVNRLMKSIADCGVMRKSVKLKCYGTKSSEEGEDATDFLRVVFNKRSLTELEVEHLCKVKWLKPELRLLEVDKSGLQWSFCPHQDAVEKNMIKLLEKMKIKRIDEVKFYGNFYLDGFLKKFSTNKIELDFFTSSCVYRSEKLKQVQDVFLCFDMAPISNDKVAEAKNFILRASSEKVSVFNDEMPPSFVTEILEMWCRREKTISWIELEILGDPYSDEFRNIREDVGRVMRYAIYGVEADTEHLRDSSVESLKKYANNGTKVIVYAVKDECAFVIVRDDSAMLRVRKTYWNDDDYFVVMEEITQ